MDTLIVVNAVLAGLFGFAALHYGVKWWFSRDERVLLFFSIQCGLYVVVCFVMASYFRSTTIPEAQARLNAIVTLGAITHAVVLHFYALLGGRRDWVFRWVVTGVMAFVAVMSILVPLRGTVIELQTAQLPWGGTGLLPILTPPGWPLGLLYLGVLAIHGYGLFVACTIWKRDRAGAVLAAAAASAILAGATIGILVDFAKVRAPYVGALPHAIFVVLMAVYFAREYAARGARLIQTLDQLQIAASAGNVGMWIRSVDGEVVWASEKAGEIWGFPSGVGFTQKDLIEKLHPDDHERVVACVGDMASGKEHYLVEFRIVGEDGDIKWIQSQGRIDTVNGERTVRGALIDITSLRMAEKAVQESEARFRNMAETAPVMIWVSDEKQATTYVNNQWLQFTGRTLEQELGLAWTRHIHPDDIGQTVERNALAFEKKVAFELEFRVRRRDGEYRWVFTSGAPRFSSEGEFLGYIGTSIDITDRKRSESELKQAHDELSKLKNQLEAENIYLQEELRQDQAIGGIVGESDAIKYVLFKVSQVAPTDATVLIAGETGTGKELVAHAIHNASQRKDRPLIKVNCAALSPSLIESELFGHEKGAFTGAGARKFGRFELANTGTLLLDEIGELPLDLQSKLLRVLQESEFERVGSGKTIKTDVRILASTNRDLKQAVGKGTFREDLWYRLNVFPITTPPLRDRREDLPVLTEHFARTFARKHGKDLTGISPETLNALCSYSWPGNVRELANVIERAVINLRGTVLRIHDDFSIRQADMLAESVLTLEDMERDHISRVLEDLNWRIDGPKGAARVLGINPSTLRFRMGKLGISKPKGRSQGQGSKQ